MNTRMSSMTAPATIVVLIATGIATVVGFNNRGFWERWMFKPEPILRHKQYERMLTSGFLHGDFPHFFVNAYSLWSFGSGIEWSYGPSTFLLIYFVAILGGSLLSLFLHRHHADYRALGASGGVCGVIYASIFLLPGGRVSLLFLPIAIPAYIYAVLYLLYTFIGLRRNADNIGHDAHLGGAIVGLLAATTLQPRLVLAQPVLFTVVMALSVVLLLWIVLDPLQLIQFRLGREEGFVGDERDRRYYENRVRRQKLEEIDRLLDRVSEYGIQSLSPAERQRLDQLSKEIGRPTGAG